MEDGEGEDAAMLVEAVLNDGAENDPSPICSQSSGKLIKKDAETKNGSREESSITCVEEDNLNCSKKINGVVESFEEVGKDSVDETSSASCKNNGVNLAVSSEPNCSIEQGRQLRKRKRPSSPATEDLKCTKEAEKVPEENVEYKGFKKKMLAQASQSLCNTEAEEHHQIDGVTEATIDNFLSGLSAVSNSNDDELDRLQPSSNTQLTEYAQYLGLQPTLKFKCYKCSETGFPSMQKLQEHQNVCLQNVNTINDSKPTSAVTSLDPSSSTNFRISRKVFLCSVCGTYYENWNMFLHMIEFHKKYICLLCLALFAGVEKLVQHLTSKHGMSEGKYATTDQFLQEFKGSLYLMCCDCEKIFTEKDNFYEHECSKTAESTSDQSCSLCGLKGAHFTTCRKAFTNGSLVTKAQAESSNSLPVSKSSTSTTQGVVTAKPSTSRKPSVPPKTDKTTAPSPDKIREISDLEEDYDISDAASFCHVNIEEQNEKLKTSKKSFSSDEALVSPIQTEGSAVTNEETNEKDDKGKGVVKEDSKVNMKEDEIKADSSAPNKTDTTCNDNEISDNISEKSYASDKVSNEEETGQEEDEEDKNNVLSKADEPEQDMKQEEGKISENTSSTSIPMPVKDSDVSDEGSREEKDQKSSSSSDSESDLSDSGGDHPPVDDTTNSSDESSDESKSKEGTAKVEESSEEKIDDKAEPDISGAEETQTDVSEKPTAEISSGDLCDSKPDHDTDGDNKQTQEANEVTPDENVSSDDKNEVSDSIQMAGDDVPMLELTLEEEIDLLNIQALVKECVKVSCVSCVFCNHAKKIAVNGKQLVLHLLAEHRYEPVVCSDSGELTPVEGFTEKLKNSLNDLQDMFFNTDTYDSSDKSLFRPFDRTYECFHCHFVTTIHKDLYFHNRKMHQKTILLCIMCKSNFYSYSELLCHVCPGIYVPDSSILFRCCLCSVDGLPSGFRLMVHLRKRHHACDVCLETTGDQQKLSNHVWKHKLHHLCYRCGIAYRNKPDITKHLFWKHGTESVLCKKCLQKKWPHVYHFCIPPNAFVCEECNSSFSKAVALKVHKRLHGGEIPYACEHCDERFISKKLLKKHGIKHGLFDKDVGDNPDSAEVDPSDGNKEVTNEDSSIENEKKSCQNSANDLGIDKNQHDNDTDVATEQSDSMNMKSKVVDVYDLPPLNLSSESDDSDDEKDTQISKKPDSPKIETVESVNEEKSSETSAGHTETKDDDSQPSEEPPVQVLDGVWDNFKNYKASLEKQESLQGDIVTSKSEEKETQILSPQAEKLSEADLENQKMMMIVLNDHDYCVAANVVKETSSNVESASLPEDTPTEVPENEVTQSQSNDEKQDDEKSSSFGADHNYCTNNDTSPQPDVQNEIHQPISPTPKLEEASPVNKKKQKSPKKKQKRSASSSSDDSSSSDYSSCSCGTNCSCSSSSSSSGSSSSQSSDSDSSSSESRKKQMPKSEVISESIKQEDVDDDDSPNILKDSNLSVRNITEKENELFSVNVSKDDSLEISIRESDLDTDETETDEDFYDKFPQKQANKLLAEKRNQLLLAEAIPLAVNNGSITQQIQPSPPPPQLPPPPPPPVLTPAPHPPPVKEPISKKKEKTKRRKKGHQVAATAKSDNHGYDIPYYNNQSTAFSNVHKPNILNQSVHSIVSSGRSQDTFSSVKADHKRTVSPYHNTGSSSETDSKRLSKRKRVPKRFYGDSSDDEAEQPVKWRKSLSQINSNASPIVQPPVSYSVKRMPALPEVHHQSKSEDEDADDSDSDQEQKSSSSDSSASDSDVDRDASDGDSETETSFGTQTNSVAVSGNDTQQKSENLYCYCQCPYDEVSEMIACDGKDCTIEWFHFECVGIMVPPKGKWFCPDCRKRSTSRYDHLLHV